MSDGIMRSTRFKWTVAIVLIVCLMGLSVGVWYWSGKPEVSTEAKSKAQELYDLAEQYGIPVPADEARTVDTFAEIYGENGGYGVELARSNLRAAVLYHEFGQTGMVNQRPNIVNPEFLAFQVLVLKVYRPDIYDDVLRYVGSRKYYENKLPQWMLDDYNALPK